MATMTLVTMIIALILAGDPTGTELCAAPDGDGVLTVSQARAHRQKARNRRMSRRQGQEALPAPAVSDEHYGPHRLQVFDLWQPTTKTPAPIVLFIHGGGFRGGDKRMMSKRFLEQCLAGGYSVATINYRLIPEVSFPAPMNDCARAIQHLRHHAKRWRLDPTRIASTGGSAGGGISLWLAFHDDLAKPDSPDPIARQSTRLTCVAVGGAQSSYDPEFAKRIGLEPLVRHPSFLAFYGLRREEVDTPRARKLFAQASPITYVTRDDPPALLDYGHPNQPIDADTPMGVVVHHPRFGLALKERMDAVGVECIVQYPGMTHGKRVEKFAFIRKHFKQAAATSKPGH